MEDARTLLDLVVTAAAAYQRPDLERRLKATAARLADPAFHVLVVGEFKQGKSSLVNALVGAPICPVDDDVATAVPTAVRYGETPTARVRFESDDAGQELVEEIAIADVASYVTETANPENRARVRLVEVWLPRRVLATGIVLVDTPGVGGLGSVHAATTLAALPMADAVLFVSDTSQEYSGPELEFLGQARELCPNVACVLTKIDFYPAWRKVVELDRGHLDAAGVAAPLLPVSSTLRVEAVETNNQDLNHESGFPGVVDHLRDEVARQAAQGVVGAAQADMRWAVSQLHAQFEGERAALQDPERAQAVLARLQNAKERADTLRGQAARWQLVLSDGIGDLTSDLDHDLRNRLREVIREAEEAIDVSDPGEMWAEFEPWLYRRTAEDVAHHYSLMDKRGRSLAEEVAAVFALDGDEIALVLHAGASTDALGSPTSIGDVQLKAGSAVNTAMTAMRGAHGGVLMFGMMANLLGLAFLSAPVLGIGLFLGRKALKDEKERQLAGRRAQAKNSVRKYVDEVSFGVSKDSRDSLRRVHRQLRDHFATQADELHRSAADSFTAAQSALQDDEHQRARRLSDVQAELQRLTALGRRVESLAGQ